jgi:hypothetical protein
MDIKKAASASSNQKFSEKYVSEVRGDEQGKNSERQTIFAGKLRFFEKLSHPTASLQFKCPTFKQKSKPGLMAAPRDVIGDIAQKLSASDLYSLSRTGKTMRDAIRPDAFWSAVISLNLQKVSTLASFRRLLRIGTPPANKLAETLRRTKLEPQPRAKLLKNLPWRILSLPAGEQKDAAEALLKVAREHAGRPSLMFDTSVVSPNMTAEQVIRTLRAKEAEIVAHARDACGGCKRAQDVRDVATELGVSSSTGIEKLMQYAAEARVAGGDKPDVVAVELSISRAARSDLDRQVMVINDSDIHAMLADGHPEEEIENMYGLKQGALRRLSVMAAPLITPGALQRRRA